LSAVFVAALGAGLPPDRNLKIYFSGPDMPPEVRAKFLQTLQNLQPGTWYTVCHPGLYARRQAQSVELICVAKGDRHRRRDRICKDGVIEATEPVPFCDWRPSAVVL
jgi:hypothetical protein